MTICWDRFVEVVHGHHRFLLTSHIRPDCDALGSELALAQILEAVGKEAVIVNGHATPPNLAFLDPEHRIRTLGTDVQAASLGDYDVLIVLDTSAWVQLGPMADVVRAWPRTKLVVDHHVSADDLGTEPFKDPAAEATGRLILEAAHVLGVEITPKIATALFAAIATDTGWFRFASTTSNTYRHAATLIDAGAAPSIIYNELYERDGLGRVRLRGLILSRTASELEGRLAYTHVLKEDFGHVGALSSDTEDVINIVLTIAGTQFAVIFVELLTGGFKISFRSRCELDCSRIAELFGGGGHRAAAGATVAGAYPEVQERVLSVIRAAMK
jgi:bifunctional oligoribonuclease and PAP phosphatase NrnA